MKRFEKSTLPRTRPSGGISTSLTSEVTILPNAAPMMRPTARSTTLPRIAKSRNSFSISHPLDRAHRIIAGSGIVLSLAEQRQELVEGGNLRPAIGRCGGLGGEPLVQRREAL